MIIVMLLAGLGVLGIGLAKKQKADYEAEETARKIEIAAQAKAQADALARAQEIKRRQLVAQQKARIAAQVRTPTTPRAKLQAHALRRSTVSATKPFSVSAGYIMEGMEDDRHL